MQTIKPRRLLFSMLTVLTIAIVGCGNKDGDPTGADGGIGGGNTPRTQVPQHLVGMWFSGTIGLTNFYNPSNGQWTSGRGFGMFYKLNPDGTYEYGWQGQVTYYGCTTAGLVFKKGTVVVSDSVLTLYSTFGRAKGEYTCTPASNFDRPEPASTTRIVIQRAQDEQGNPIAFIRPVDGEYMQYKRLE